MKLGLDSYCFHRFFGEVYTGQAEPGDRWTLADLARVVRDLPVECVSLETCFLPPDETALRAQLEQFEVEFMFAWGHPDGFMGPAEAAAVAEIEKYLRLSAACRCRVLRIAASSLSYFFQPHRPQIELAVGRLGRLVPLAERYQVRLALENHGDFYRRELDEILERVSSPLLGIALDTGNHLRLGEDPTEAAEHWGGKVFLVHAKDVAPVEGMAAGDPRGLACVPAGRGITDFHSIVRALGQTGYDGMFVVELSRVHPAFAHLDETTIVAEGLDYLHKLRGEPGVSPSHGGEGRAR